MNLPNKSIIYITFGILLQFLVEVKSQTTAGIRHGHTATYINEKIYIFGGTTSDNISPKETFLYLDVSVPFNTSELKWIDLTNNSNIVPPHAFAAAIRS